MKIFTLTTFLCLVASLGVRAQAIRQAENWHFGQGISVRFVDGVPRAGTSAIRGLEGVASLSDTLGNLLFYTNGGGRRQTQDFLDAGTIWNRNDGVLYDMLGQEGGGFSARQSAIAMPDPGGRAGIYYLFTMEESEYNEGGAVAGQELGRGLSYFEIDMRLNDGLGAVVTSVPQVYVPAYEGLDATPMADGSGYWLVCHDNSTQSAGAPTGTLIVLPFTAAGVGEPRRYPLPFASNGRLEFSPDGRKLYFNGRLFAFDPATGALGASLRAFPAASTAACFTPDSRYLYYTETRPGLGEVIVRYDLSDYATIDVERVAVNDAQVLLLAGFQIGPNHNIYFLEERLNATEVRSYGLSEIACVSSPVPTVTRLLLPLPVAKELPLSPQSLPQFVDAIFQRPALADTLRLDTLTLTACRGEAVVLRPREAGTNFRWVDDSTADSLAVRTDGTYCLTITGGCQPTVDCQTILFRDPTPAYEVLESSDAGCAGQFHRVRFTAATTIDSVRVTYRESAGNAYYTETFAGTAATLPYPRCGEDQQLTATVFGPCPTEPLPLTLPGCGDDRFRPELRLLTEGDLCRGRDFTLEAGNPGSLLLAELRWEDGATANPRTFAADPQSTYRATAFSACGDSVLLTFAEPIAEVCACRDEVPELITPNGDGTNDTFRLFSNCPPEDFTLIVYNRWGQPVYSTTDPDRGWDGTRNGQPQPPEVYLYRMAFRLPGVEGVQLRDGQFSLVR